MSREVRTRKKRARLSPLTVIGELLFMGGLIVVGYLVWQPWYTTTVVVGQQVELSAQASAQLRANAAQMPDESNDAGEIPVAAAAPENEIFGVIYIPSFGSSFANVLAEGTSPRAVLNAGDKGVGRYEQTQLIGEPGNIALAGHRSGPFTTPFKDIMSLRLNDPIYIETADGWYTYRFRSLEYVLPEETDVLQPFPRLEGTPGTDRILTLTTCHPENWSIAERAIAYSVFEEFRPASEGPPPELAAVNSAVTKV